MFKFLDLTLNKLPIFKLLDGHKTVIAGILAAVGCAAGIVAGVSGPETAQVLMTVSNYANQAAGYLGVVGVCGKVVKR